MVETESEPARNPELQSYLIPSPDLLFSAGADPFFSFSWPTIFPVSKFKRTSFGFFWRAGRVNALFLMCHFCKVPKQGVDTPRSPTAGLHGPGLNVFGLGSSSPGGFTSRWAGLRRSKESSDGAPVPG
jgi:hypothetical protein